MYLQYNWLLSLEKENMEILVADAFAQRDISVLLGRTKIGRDMIFRKGDPTQNHDLVRVAAHKATSICIMMTEHDAKAISEGGKTHNSETIRTVLALRNLVFANGEPEETFKRDLRVVVQLSGPCRFINAANFVSPTGKPCLYRVGITRPRASKRREGEHAFSASSHTR